MNDKYGLTFGESSFIYMALVIMFGADLPSSAQLLRKLVDTKMG